MSLLLPGFPEPVTTDVKPPTATEPDVVVQLAEGEDPVLRPDGPGDRFGRGLRAVPPADSNDGGVGGNLIAGGVGSVFGHENGLVAGKAVEEVCGERGGVAVDVELFMTLFSLVYMVGLKLTEQSRERDSTCRTLAQTVHHSRNLVSPTEIGRHSNGGLLTPDLLLNTQ